ncbi:MAG: YceI family protein [Caldilineaceae bacterium]
MQLRSLARSWLIVLIVVLALGLAACSQDEESAPAVEADAPAVEATTAPEPTLEPTEVPTEAPATESSAEEGAAEATAEPTEAPAEEAAAAADPLTFVIDAERSEVRFVVNEVLRGQPTTVTGVNSGVSGEILVDQANPAASQIGVLTIDAATFVTDNNQRNGAIRRFILQSGNHPTITFAPTEISGMPESVAVGDTVDFQVTGDLTIRNITNAPSPSM